MKRKLDVLYESSRWYIDPKFTIDKEIIPMIWSVQSSTKPADCQEEEKIIVKPVISFEYAGKWKKQFPLHLTEVITSIILDYIACFDLLQQRLYGRLINICCCCGTRKINTPNFPITCHRCLAFFCHSCWSESKRIMHTKARRLVLKYNSKFFNNKELDQCTLVLDYHHCPSCLSGSPFQLPIIESKKNKRKNN